MPPRPGCRRPKRHFPQLLPRKRVRSIEPRLAHDHKDEVLGLHGLRRHALEVDQRYRLEMAIALLDIVHVQVILPEPHQVARDLGVGIESQREGSGDVGLGVLHLPLCRVFLAQPVDVLADQAHRLAGRLIHG